MDWKVFDALESKSNKLNAINAIMAIEVNNRRVIMTNTLAQKYFSKEDNPINLRRVFGDDMDLQEVFDAISKELENNIETELEKIDLFGKSGEKMNCAVEFTYATPDKKFLFMKIHPIIDNRPYYMERFIETRTRPAFTLNVNENLTVTFGNELFYQSFACNKTSMKLRYKNFFGNLLAKENRKDYEQLIHESIKTERAARLEIPVQTARGEMLWFYFDTLRLRQLEDDCRNNLFCLLVSKEDTLEQLSNPFHNKC